MDIFWNCTLTTELIKCDKSFYDQGFFNLQCVTNNNIISHVMNFLKSFKLGYNLISEGILFHRTDPL